MRSKINVWNARGSVEFNLSCALLINISLITLVIQIPSKWENYVK